MASGSQNNTSFQAQKWTNLRAFTIGNTAKDVDGTAAVSWSKNEILGASDSTKFYRGDKTWSNILTGALDLKSDLNLYTASADSPDIVWWYADKGKEQARLWMGSGFSSKAAPNFKEYKSDGTSLYSGVLPLGDGTGASGTWGISVTGNAATATALTSNAGGTEQPIYFTGGKPAATSYALKATVNNGTEGRISYYSGDKAISATTNVHVLNNYLISNSRNGASVDIRANGLIIWGQTYGNTANQMISNTAGVFRFGDGGPQIVFNTSNSWNAQAGALIFTDNDNAGTGTSFHFVSTESSNNNGGDCTVTAPRFRARAGLTVGQNSDNTSYNLYVNGSTYFNGNTTHNGIDYFANGTTYYINNSGDSRLRYEYANAHIGYDSAGFIESIAGSPWPYIRFDTRAGGSTYVTTAQTNWCELYAQVPAKKDTTYYKTRFFFRQYSKTANTTTRLNYYEDYYLPETNDGRTGNAGYNILTTKDLSFSITGSSASCTGNAATATKATQDGSGNTITSYYVTLSTDQIITGTKTFHKRIIAYGYKQANNLPFMTFDKPGNNAAGIGPDGTSNRIKFGPCDLAGTAWVAQSSFNSNEWYFQGKITATSTVTATGFTGNVTGNCSGSSGSCTGNAAGLTGGLVTNTVTSYGNLAVTTAKGSYYGINLGHNKSGMSIMSINASHQGLYNETNGQWILYYNAASSSKSIAIGSATTNVTSGISLNLNTKVTGTLTVTGQITGNVTGNCSGSSGSCTGNAATATSAGKWATARTLTIGNKGQSVDGSGKVSWTLQDILIRSSNEFDFVADAGISAIHFNHKSQSGRNTTTATTAYYFKNGQGATTGVTIYAAAFNGNLTGNVTGNCSGSSGSCTGNAATATKLGTANKGSANHPIYLSGGTPTECAYPKSGAWWTAVPFIHSDGMMEIGRYIDFHGTSNMTGDHTIRFTCATNTARIDCNGIFAATGWSDLAEYRHTIEHEPGRAVIPTDCGIAKRATKRLQPGARIVSDTYGFCLGESDDEQSPIALTGRVLAYPCRPISEYHAGDAVCSGPNGTVDLMTREEIQKYPDCIIGIVNEIPTYPIWNPKHTDDRQKVVFNENVEVRGRIWIDVK